LQHRKYADFTKDPERAFQELLEVIRPQPARLFFEPEMVLIPAGEFLMGSDPEKDKYARKDEQPQHKLYLPDYYMAKTPITNVQYLRWINKNPPTGKENHPVVFVVWRDAMVYCRWLSEVTGKSYHLPSEAEWEKAARGTDGRIWPWGNVPPDATQCNYNMTVDNTTPIGQYPKGASPYGVLDMAGNVWEWTSSLYKEYPYKAADGREDPDAEGRRVVRGGSFNYYGRHVRCACRFRYLPDFRGDLIGFRVVASHIILSTWAMRIFVHARNARRCGLSGRG
jgi:formylglycine-generating enzyme required for sulfatase activity